MCIRDSTITSTRKTLNHTTLSEKLKTVAISVERNIVNTCYYSKHIVFTEYKLNSENYLKSSYSLAVSVYILM